MARNVASPSDSSLSPPPNEEILAAQAETDLSVKTEVNGRKRKVETTVKATKHARKLAVKKDQVEAEDEHTGEEETPKPKRTKRTPKVKVQDETIEEEVKVTEGETGATEVKVKRKRQSKKKLEDLPPLEQRTVGSNLLVGAHVSVVGGVHNSIPNAVFIGANAMAFFLKNQRKWENPELNTEHADMFLKWSADHGIDAGKCCLPHGSYLVNLAHPAEDRKKQAYGSFHDDLTRCHKLGIKLYNFHPGNSNAGTREEGIQTIAENLNKAHKSPETGEVVTLLETMASLGNTIGGTFKDLAEIIALVDKKDRVGVCLDTCHVFAAGYDLRTPESFAEVMTEFDNVIGLKYLKALHVNDSKAPFASYRDLHARIGTGYLGLRSFHNIVNDKRLHGLPMVLETPIEVTNEEGKKVDDKGIWAREIKMLENLVGMDVESKDFKNMEKELFEQGVSERERIGEQVERKKQKDAGEKVPRKRKSKKKDEEAEDEANADGDHASVDEEKVPKKRKRTSKKQVKGEDEVDQPDEDA